MRKFAFIPMLLFISIYSQAQQLRIRPLLAFGSSSEINDGSISWGEDEIPGERKFKPSYALGIGADYSLGKHWTLGLDMMYSKEGKNIRYKSESNFYDYNNESNVNYFRIPVNISYYFRKPTAKIRPYLSTGVALGILLRQRVNYKPNNSQTSDLFASADILIPEYKTIDFGVQLGAGCQYKLNQKTAIFAEVKYYNGAIIPIEPALINERNQNLRIQIGYSFCLK